MSKLNFKWNMRLFISGPPYITSQNFFKSMTLAIFENFKEFSQILE